MKRPGPPLFLEREGYRRRRLMDAARVLPVLGVLLFLLPVLWAPHTTPETDTATGGLYLFAIWAGLIFAAFLLSRRLDTDPRPRPPADPPPEPPRAGPRGG